MSSPAEEVALSSLAALSSPQLKPIIATPPQNHVMFVQFKLGSKILVSNSPEIQQKLPKLAGLSGSIVEIPQHPNTWYTIRMDDTGALIKLRKSAFDPIMPIEPENAKPGMNSLQLTAQELLKLDEFKCKSRSLTFGPYIQGTNVTISSGKYQGQLGTTISVTSSGHICVRLSSGNVIMKKSSDIQMIDLSTKEGVIAVDSSPIVTILSQVSSAPQSPISSSPSAEPCNNNTSEDLCKAEQLPPPPPLPTSIQGIRRSRDKSMLELDSTKKRKRTDLIY